MKNSSLFPSILAISFIHLCFSFHYKHVDLHSPWRVLIYIYRIRVLQQSTLNSPVFTTPALMTDNINRNCKNWINITTIVLHHTRKWWAKSRCFNISASFFGSLKLEKPFFHICLSNSQKIIAQLGCFKNIATLKNGQ